MLSRPNYCCSCGEKIDRVEWHIWTSRRYCELCQTEHQLDEWLPRFIGAAIVVFGLAGLGSTLHIIDEEATLRTSPVRFAKERASETAVTIVGEVAEHRDTDDSAPLRPEMKKGSEGLTPGTDPQVSAGEDPPRAPAASPESEAYFCGAETKKGTPCTRRVKGNVRCWQHKGREPMLPREELAAGDTD